MRNLSMFLPHFFQQLEPETKSDIPEPKIAPSQATADTFDRAANALGDRIEQVRSEIARLKELEHELNISFNAVCAGAKALGKLRVGPTPGEIEAEVALELPVGWDKIEP